MQIETPPSEKPYEKPEGERRGLVIVNTGDGKGKSTAAFGLALRAHGRGKAVKITPSGPMVASMLELEVHAAESGLGLIYTFDEYLRPSLDSGALVPVLEDWWQSFSGPFLYYPSRTHMPAPLRAFVDFLKNEGQPA